MRVGAVTLSLFLNGGGGVFLLLFLSTSTSLYHITLMLFLIRVNYLLCVVDQKRRWVPRDFLFFGDDGYGPRWEKRAHLFVLGLWSLSSCARPLTWGRV